jgi:hypothetical protein
MFAFLFIKMRLINQKKKKKKDNKKQQDHKGEQ